jgi:hypothetical protein
LPSSTLRRASVIVTAGLVIGVPSGSFAQEDTDPYYDVGTGPVTITIKRKGKRLYFSGPKKVSRGALLTVRNATNPAKVGRHTFSLVNPSRVPRTKRQRRRCLVCRRIAAAHKYHPKTDKIGKPIVDVGQEGWDKRFGTRGDSWVVERKGKSHTRRVTAHTGTRLTYFCGVHPSMKGTITVIAATASA